ncbi:tryptophan halogenase family protein [Paraferrimonas sedimenticola]|uniref:Tryptophan halogenase n=1 Tax=Paraferrimonas sedimenticola TaxID=375674 RepID=A0AA37RZA1_9GAMM|nr:tryptophan halogenase family protein [Paraferrimonas sedimenticola]GLP97637.1 tryptophan halogenase [Paraferrimonas sedimenticola]
MAQAIQHVLIVGGGTAGWLTAAILASEHASHKDNGITVTLVESPDVATIGVGEGTWPTMRETLQRIGLNERDFLSFTQASYKQGSKFVGWRNGSADDAYYHPFSLPEGYLDTDILPYWQMHCGSQSLADAFSGQSRLCDADKAPKQAATPDYAGVANYGYHLDAGKFAEMLTRHCVERLGVKHIKDHIQAVEPASNGDIQAVVTRNHGPLKADLFVDCSGLNGLLIDKHYGIEFESAHQVLFNDRAIAMQVPYSEQDQAIASATIATAQSAGWIWDIGLQSRRGTGHVYSSAHMDPDQAESALRHYVAQSVGQQQAEQLSCRHISIRPGHRKQFWHRNCVAVGMAAGFIEPLEASALALVELSAKMLAEQLPRDHQTMAITAKRFNQKFLLRWQRIIEFLKLHYAISQRDDSQYWRDNRNSNSWPERLAELLELWQRQSPSRFDFEMAEEIFPSASYFYVLYGMGFQTQIASNARVQRQLQQAAKHYQQAQQKTQQMLAGLPGNRELLQQITAASMAATR